jgi:hypothetical protein
VEKKKTPAATASCARTSSLSVILRRSGSINLAEGDQGLPGAGPGETTRLGTKKISRPTSLQHARKKRREAEMTAEQGSKHPPSASISSSSLSRLHTYRIGTEHHRISWPRGRPPLMERLQAFLCTCYRHSVSSNLRQGGGAWSTSPATSRTSPDFASLAS